MFKISLVINENFGKLIVILFPPKEIIQLCIFSSPKKKKEKKMKKKKKGFPSLKKKRIKLSLTR